MILGYILEIRLLIFQLIMMRFISVNHIIFFSKLAKDNKRDMIEGLNHLKNVGGKKQGFSKRQYKIALVERKLYHMVGAPTL